MNLFHCSPHDFYWMHLFTFPVIHLVHFPPPPFPQKQDNPLGYYSCPKRDSRQSQAANKVHYGQPENSEFQTFGRCYALRCNLRSAKFLQNGKKSMYKERTLLNLSTCVSHNARMAWFVLCGLSSQIAFGRRGSLSVDQQARFTKKGSLACSFRWDKAIEWYMDTREGWCS